MHHILVFSIKSPIKSLKALKGKNYVHLHARSIRKKKKRRGKMQLTLAHSDFKNPLTILSRRKYMFGDKRNESTSKQNYLDCSMTRWMKNSKHDKVEFAQ